MMLDNQESIITCYAYQHLTELIYSKFYTVYSAF